MHREFLRHLYLRRVVAPFLGVLGLAGAQRLARWLAEGYADFPTIGRARAEARIRAAFPSMKNAVQAHRLATRMFEQVALFWTEAVLFNRFLRESSWRRCVEVRDEGAWQRLARSGRGCVLATAYFGNPAVGAYALGQIFRPIHVISDHFGEPVLRAWQHEAQRQANVRFIEPAAAVKIIPGLLEKGQAVMMIAEAERSAGRSPAVQFLGRELRCHPTLARLGRLFDVPVAAFTCARKREAGRFELALHEVVSVGASDEDERVMQRLLSSLERAILRWPEQYLWSIPTSGDGSEPPARGSGLRPVSASPMGRASRVASTTAHA